MVEAIAKLVEAIGDPLPRTWEKSVLPGRAKPRAKCAADNAGEKVARGGHGTIFF